MCAGKRICTWKANHINKSYCRITESVGSVHDILKQEYFHLFQPISYQLLVDGYTADRRVQSGESDECIAMLTQST